LAVQLIFTHGSLEAFWQQTTAAVSPDLEQVTAQVKPGYYLLLAKKGKA